MSIQESISYYNMYNNECGCITRSWDREMLDFAISREELILFSNNVVQTIDEYYTNVFCECGSSFFLFPDLE